MTKLHITATVLLLTAALLLGGCSKQTETSLTDSDRSTSSEISDSNSSSENPDNSESSDSVPEKKKPDGEPTILIGLNGEAVYTSEITEISDGLSFNDLTPDNLMVKAVCDGFVYLKESTGISYNTYENPELFDDYLYIGDTPVNTNEWKRVNVGDTICGLTLKSAKTGFRISDQFDFPEKYFDPTNQYCEFEGEITLTGFLYITPRNLYEPDGGTMSISFVDAALPMMAVYLRDDLSGYDRAFLKCTEGDGSLWGYTEYWSIGLDETMQKTSVYLGGLRAGDIAKVKATLSRMKIDSGGYASAHLEDIELLSDVIIHVDDLV